MTLDEVQALIPTLPDGYTLEPRVMRTFKFGNVEIGLELWRNGVFVRGNRGIYASTIRREIAAYVHWVETATCWWCHAPETFRRVEVGAETRPICDVCWERNSPTVPMEVPIR